VKVLDGRHVAAAIEKEVADKIGDGLSPYLVVVLVGEDPASELYVRRKMAACQRVGITSEVVKLPDTTLLMRSLENLNINPKVHGILVQLPLPKGYSKHAVFDAVSPQKDVDGFHTENVGLALQGRPRFLPCTSMAVERILMGNGISLEGKHVVIANRSDVVGKPLFGMLVQDIAHRANATVTMCHDKTPASMFRRICRQADIIVSATGIVGFITPDLVHEETVVVDVGINRDAHGRLCGDVDYEPVLHKAHAVTPVPGGVGPLTVSCLLENTYRASRLHLERG
jgi:methylenetetrahydrofolate dehydrogenase (NADP+)/methenyltetrahydrofolate cyclohydrolase